MKASMTLIIILVIILAALNIVLIQTCYRQFVKLRSERVVSYYCPTPQTSPDKTYMLFLGDSRISRWNPLPDFKDVEVLNLGCGGAISADLLVQVIQMDYPENVKMAVIEIGINDLTAIALCPWQKNTIISRCQSNIKQTILFLRQKGIPVTVLPVLPAGKVGWLRRLVWSDEIDKAIFEVNQFLFRLKAEGVTLAECSEVIEKDGRLRLQYAEDALHLNALGYKKLNTILLSSMNQLLHEREI